PGHHSEAVVRAQGWARCRHVEQHELVDRRLLSVRADQRAARQQPLREFLADKSGATGDHDLHGLLLVWRGWSAPGYRAGAPVVFYRDRDRRQVAMALGLAPSLQTSLGPNPDAAPELGDRRERMRRLAWLASALLHAMVLALLLGLWTSPHVDDFPVIQ